MSVIINSQRRLLTRNTATRTLSARTLSARTLSARTLSARSSGNWFASLARFSRRERCANTIRIVCQSGVVWVTMENDARDYFVQAGETRCFSATTHIVAQGLGEASFLIEKCEG